MAANDKDNRAIFKGGTSLTKAYGIGSRFSEDIDIAISEAWTLSGNQLKMLIKRTAKSMTEGLQEINIPGFTSKGSHGFSYHQKSAFCMVYIEQCLCKRITRPCI